MSEQEPKQRGVIRRSVGWYFSALGSGVKGAVGTESLRQASQLTGAVADTVVNSVKLKQCPRCGDHTLRHDQAGYKCLQESICGFQATTAEEVEVARKEMANVDPRVLALSKGFTGDFKKRGAGARRVCWFFWAVTLLVSIYGLSWAFDGRWAYAVWVCLVAVYSGLIAVRFAYGAHMASCEGRVMRKLDFLLSPHMWFPVARSEH